MTNLIAIQKSKTAGKFKIISMEDGLATLEGPKGQKVIKVASLKKAYTIIKIEPKAASSETSLLVDAMNAILKDNDLPKQNKKWHAGLLYSNGYSLQQIAKYFAVTAPQIRVYLVYLGLYEPGIKTAQYKKYLDGQSRFAPYFKK